jgi:hypothetical protein
MVYPVCTRDATAVSQTVLPWIHGASRMYPGCIQSARCSFLRRRCIQGVSRVCHMQGCATFVSSVYPVCVQYVIRVVSDAVAYRMCIHIVSMVYPVCLQLTPIQFVWPRCIHSVSMVYPLCTHCLYPVCAHDVTAVSQTVLPQIHGHTGCIQGIFKAHPALSCSFIVSSVYPLCIHGVSMVCSWYTRGSRFIHGVETRSCFLRPRRANNTRGYEGGWIQIGYILDTQWIQT